MLLVRPVWLKVADTKSQGTFSNTSETHMDTYSRSGSGAA